MSERGLDAGLNEVALNRELYWCIVEAQRDLGSQGLAPLAPVIPEGHNSPAADDHERAPRENKIPDFQWGLTDDQAADVRESAKHFVVECKCLMTPRRKDWIYTEQYVTAGVRRFVAPDHAYGMGTRDGAMVGYVRTLTFAQVLDQLATHFAHEGLSVPVEFTRQGEDHLELTHALSRPFKDSPFQLAHLWRRL
jgi:hypothetical protein